MKKIALIALLVMPALATAAWSADGEDTVSHDTESARSVVESFHAALAGGMSEAVDQGVQGRYRRLLTTIDETLDLPFMARTALGGTWRELSEPERAEFVDLFRRLSASRYAEFEIDGKARFETLGLEPAARGTVLVKTKFVQPDGGNIRFTYLLREVEGEWRVIDVLLDGKISELALRRGQYRSKIATDGYPMLVETLQSRVEEAIAP